MIEVDSLTLTALDRCDACSAQARAVILLDSGGQLMMCGHHLNQHRSALGTATIIEPEQ